MVSLSFCHRLLLVKGGTSAASCCYCAARSFFGVASMAQGAGPSIGLVCEATSEYGTCDSRICISSSVSLPRIVKVGDEKEVFYTFNDMGACSAARRMTHRVDRTIKCAESNTAAMIGTSRQISFCNSSQTLKPEFMVCQEGTRRLAFRTTARPASTRPVPAG